MDALLQETRRVLIDTDPGIDDAMALAFLRATPAVRIAAITTVFGNADLETTTRNACYLAERFSITAPIFAGAAAPLRMPRRASPEHVHGSNGLGDVAIPTTPSRKPEDGAAHETIVRMVRESPHQLSLLALGPLTNLALALRLDPGIADLVAEVVVMGGAFGFGGRRGNVTPFAEANMHNDPHAAREVLAASWRVTMVGLDVTSRCILPTQAARDLASRAGETGRFLWDISRDYEELYRRKDGVEGCCLHDVAAAVCLVAPGLFTTRSGAIRVITEGPASGQTILGPSTGDSDFPQLADAPSHQACIQADERRVVEVYEAALIAHAGKVSVAATRPESVGAQG